MDGAATRIITVSLVTCSRQIAASAAPVIRINLPHKTFKMCIFTVTYNCQSIAATFRMEYFKLSYDLYKY